MHKVFFALRTYTFSYLHCGPNIIKLSYAWCKFANQLTTQENRTYMYMKRSI